jgi:hypothetical protein
MTFDIEKFRIKPGQMDLFDNAPTIPMVAEPTKKPTKKTKASAPTRTSRVGKKLSAANKSMDLIQRTIEESAEILRNLGCEYIIVTRDGRALEHGELPARLRQQAAPAAPKKAHTSASGYVWVTLQATHREATAGGGCGRALQVFSNGCQFLCPRP